MLRMSPCSASKLTHLAQAALFDVTCADEKPGPSEVRAHAGLEAAIHPKTDKPPGVAYVNSCGRPMPILKILQTSHCQFNCRYCAFRKDADRPRDALASDELARLTVTMASRGLIEGLFLSSGIGATVRETMTRIVDSARILREKYRFRGYIHLKVLPGASLDLIEAAGRYADRLSINLEAPSETALREIAPNKQIKSNILKRMQWIETLRRTGRIPSRVGQVTQFVVGGSDDPTENDRALITVADYLYRELDFRRIYYSAFQPVPGTPLEDRPPENPLRQHRLYQADFLLSRYGFRPDDLIFDEAGRLSLELDPKEAWARAHPEFFPVDIKTADSSALLRVPGIGPILTKRILQARAERRLKSSDDLLKLGPVPRKALEFVLINGKRPEGGRVQERGWETPQLRLPF